MGNDSYSYYVGGDRIGVVFKQWYQSRNLESTPTLNAKHLRYIATRKGVVANEGCGFGLWGRLGEKPGAGNIDNLNAAMAQVREASREHTVYRSIVSLDEETALRKGYAGREQWQRLVSGHVDAIARENGIEQRDLRWCAAYHHEKGHPHAHIVFWDNSDRVRNEFMGEERFEIAAEKIRAAFNGEIFRQELKALRGEQDEAKKQLRAGSRNLVEGYGHLTFFSDEEPEEIIGVNFYPRGLGVEQAQELCRRLEELTYLLPEDGQLRYQYLPRNVKAAVDVLSGCVLEHTTLRQLRADILQTVTEIAQACGNTPEAAERQRQLAEKRLLKDIGNDVLPALVKSGWLDKREQSRLDALTARAHARTFPLALGSFTAKMQEPDFQARFTDFTKSIGRVYTPKHIVMRDAQTAAQLRSLTLECMTDEKLRGELRIGEAFSEQNPTSNAEREKKNQEWKAVYRSLADCIFDRAAAENGWTEQKHHAGAVSFLMAFCFMVSNSNRLTGYSGRFILSRELSRQARREKYLESRDASGMWAEQP